MPRWPIPAAPAVLAVIVGCASIVPKAELDRCNLGVADNNDGYRVTQGTACGMVAHRYEEAARPGDARAYARKACQLQDAFGCAEYLALVRAQSSIPPDELLDARTAGEQACAGMVIGSGGTDARPALCASTAGLYLDVEPASPRDAARLFGRACKLGDDKSCARARSLGADADAPKPSPAPSRAATLAPSPPPAPAASVASAAPPCHDLRGCVSLELVQRNANEVVGTLTNHCDGPVACTVCPSNGEHVDKALCHDVSLAPSEWRSGREAGLGYVGYSAMGYQCMAAGDDRSCLGI
jgi:hypothetical protein